MTGAKKSCERRVGLSYRRKKSAGCPGSGRLVGVPAQKKVSGGRDLVVRKKMVKYSASVIRGGQGCVQSSATSS